MQTLFFRRALTFLGLLLGGTLAHGEIVVIVSSKSSVASLSSADIAQVYLGKSAAFKPVDLPEGSALRDEFYDKVTDKSPAQVKAIWARLTFTGKAIPPQELSSSTAVARAVGSDEKAIGYVDRSAIDSSVRVVLSIP